MTFRLIGLISFWFFTPRDLTMKGTTEPQLNQYMSGPAPSTAPLSLKGDVWLHLGFNEHKEELDKSRT